jgi:hypothetical protein
MLFYKYKVKSIYSESEWELLQSYKIRMHINLILFVYHIQHVLLILQLLHFKFYVNIFYKFIKISALFSYQALGQFIYHVSMKWALVSASDNFS